MLMLKRTPSYLISDLEVKLIKLPMYESGDPAVEDLELSVEAMPFQFFATTLAFFFLSFSV